ncbi:hypothetical protein BH11BAC6_BH11BAC6_05640 [soil metagenome]
MVLIKYDFNNAVPAIGKGVNQQFFLLIKFKNAMSNLLYIIAVIMVIIWAIGYFGYAAGGLIHLLLVIAVISIVINLVRGRSV